MATILEALRPTSQLAQDAMDTGAQHKLLIGGAWVAPLSRRWIETVDPATGRSLGQIADAGPEDIDAAVAAARIAFERGWGVMTPGDRAKILWAIADKLEAHIDELAELETLDQGKPLFVGRWAEIPGAIAQFRFFAGQATAIEGRTISTSINYQPAGKEVHAWTSREALGVVAAIVPWNSPLVLTAMKLAPALAAGCTVVLKPAENTSLTAIRLGELMMEAGLPAGALNIVTGVGATCGAALASHMGVNKVAFTGSTATGRAILDASKSNMKRVTLELGGKSPVIVLPDADLSQATPGAANAIFFNAGQVCIAGSRTYVHSSIYDQVLEGLSGIANGMQLGHGLNPGSHMGPVVSVRQAEQIEAHIQGAKAGGAAIVAGGERLGVAGTFITPTIVAEVKPSMAIVREEVFGPVMVVQRYDDLDAVLAAANDSVYGLAASVWTESLSHAHRISKRLQAGTVWINCHAMYDPSLPIGGVKQSGYGRDSGAVAMDNYLEWKTVCAVL